MVFYQVEKSKRILIGRESVDKGKKIKNGEVWRENEKNRRNKILKVKRILKIEEREFCLLLFYIMYNFLFFYQFRYIKALFLLILVDENI